MSSNLILRAGPKALEYIRDNGLAADDIKAIYGAAGGPKWLILSHLDRALFSRWIKHRKAPLFLIGSSAGAWRFASACQADPLAAIDRFQAVYVGQCYHQFPPTPAQISLEGDKILSHLLLENGHHEILNHPFLRLSVMTARCKGWTAKADKLYQSVGFGAAAICNAFTRNGLKLFFERALFYDPRDLPPFLNMNQLPIQRIPLTPVNIKPALLASGSIPIVMNGIENIPGAAAGIYRDGGITDYHMNIPFNGSQGIVLFPHYTHRIIPGWLDKKLPWRKPVARNMDRMLLIAPSESFLEKLPYRKIPDRNDFKVFQGRDGERMSYWNKAVDMGKALADEFMECVDSGRIREKIKAFS